MRKYLVLIGAAWLQMTLCGSATLFAQSDTPGLSPEEIASKTKSLVDPYIDDGVLQSVSIGIISGDFSQTFGFGAAQLGKDDAPDANTVYEIGSISKVFTGILLADAIERRLVKADQPAQELLPAGRSMPTWKRDPSKVITLAHLSNHISGLPRQPDNIDFSIDPLNPYAAYKSDATFDFLDKHRLRREPGKFVRYSNLGAGLLGYLISKKQSMPYEKLMIERIAKPLGMNDTTISLSDSQQQRLATPTNKQLKKDGNWDFPATLAPAGAIRSTAADMLKFARANLEAPDNELGDAIELAWQKQYEPNGGAGAAFGFGWFINHSSETHWHNGGTGGYKTMIKINREKKLALVVLSNTSSDEVDTLASKLMQRLMAGKPKEMAFDATAAEKYIGRYELRKGIHLDVAWADETKSGLTVQLTGQGPLPIHQQSRKRWFLKVLEAELEFSFKGNRPNAVTLIQNGNRQKAKRIRK